MAKMMIRVDVDLTDELLTAFPHMSARHQPASTTLTGEVTDQQELQGLMALMDSLGITVAEVVTIPDEIGQPSGAWR